MKIIILKILKELKEYSVLVYLISAIFIIYVSFYIYNNYEPPDLSDSIEIESFEEFSDSTNSKPGELTETKYNYILEQVANLLLEHKEIKYMHSYLSENTVKYDLIIEGGTGQYIKKHSLDFEAQVNNLCTILKSIWNYVGVDRKIEVYILDEKHSDQVILISEDSMIIYSIY